jgi:hypothetical protein
MRMWIKVPACDHAFAIGEDSVWILHRAKTAFALPPASID